MTVFDPEFSHRFHMPFADSIDDVRSESRLPVAAQNVFDSKQRSEGPYGYAHPLLEEFGCKAAMRVHGE